MAEPSGARSSVAVQFVALAAIWGASFLFMRVALDGLSPLQVVVGRLIVGAVVLVVVMVITGRRWPRGRRVWAHLTVIAVLLCVIPFLLFAWAGQHLDSGLSSVFNATTPITTLLVSLLALPDERLTRTRTFGVVLAAVGVVIVGAPWQLLGRLSTDGDVLLAQVACLGATTSYGVAFVYSRRVLRGHQLDPAAVATAQVGIAAVLTAALVPVAGLTPIDLTPEVVISMVLLGALGTGLAFLWNTRIILVLGATIASTVTYLTPVVGVTLGVVILGERLDWHEPIGAALVLLGVVVSRVRPQNLRSRSRHGPTSVREGCQPRDAAGASAVPSGASQTHEEDDMGLMDSAKDAAESTGEKVGEAFEDAKERAGDKVDEMRADAEVGKAEAERDAVHAKNEHKENLRHD